jgi:hypothetical protein
MTAMTDILPCQKCKAKYGNNGIPRLYRRTESDMGGYYPAHVRCEQCSTDGPGRASSERAIEAWNEGQRTRVLKRKAKLARAACSHTVR